MLSFRHLTSDYVPSYKCSENGKDAPLHWMITSKGKINELCLICRFFSFFFFFHPPLSIYLSPSTNGVMIWKVLWGWKSAQWAAHNCVASSLMDIPVLIVWAQCHERKKSFRSAPYKSKTPMLKSGYLAIVGVSATEWWNSRACKRADTHVHPENPEEHIHDHAKLISFSPSIAPGLKVEMVAVLCWRTRRRDWNRTARKSNFTAGLSNTSTVNLSSLIGTRRSSSLCVLFIFLLIGRWIADVTTTIIQNICYALVIFIVLQYNWINVHDQHVLKSKINLRQWDDLDI